MDRVLVTGGTGTLGRAVVAALREAGHAVRVLSRRAAPENEPSEAWATGDLRSGEGIDAACAGVSTIIHCATTLGRADVAATRTLVGAAERAEVGHLVHISIVGIDEIPMFYYRAKWDCESVLLASGVPVTILRATQFHDLVAMLCHAQRRLPVTLVPSGFSMQPVDVRDVADRLVELASGEPAGRVADMGGPEVRTMEEWARVHASEQGRTPRVWSVPIPGALGRAFRAGKNLTPEHADGRRGFAEYVREHSGR